MSWLCKIFDLEYMSAERRAKIYRIGYDSGYEDGKVGKEKSNHLTPA